MMNRIFSFAISFMILSALTIYSQDSPSVKISGMTSKLKVKAGETFSIRMVMEIPEGFYTYSIKEQIGPEGIGPMSTYISLEPADALEISGDIKALDEHEKYDKGFEMQVKYYDGSARFNLPVKAKKAIDFTKDKISIVVNMQICKGTSCFPPEDFTGIVLGKAFSPAEQEITPEEKAEEIIETPVDSVALTETAQDKTEVEEEAQEDISKAEDIKIEKAEETVVGDEQAEDKEKKSIWSTILIGMLAGLLALTTPCVYPMVPITVSFFTKRAEQTKGKGLRDAVVYALGIILTFTFLGFIISSIFGPDAMQQLSTSPGINIFITAVFVVFALSLFGMFELQLPTGLMNKLNMKSQQGSGIGSVLLMGLTFSLASFSCTGPIVGSALIEASTGGFIHPIISMLSFSTVLAAPFFLLALFPNATSGMPKAGGWMNNIKVVLAFILIAVSMKFFDMALQGWGIGMSRDLFLAVWVASSLLITLYLLGIFRMSHDSPIESVSSLRIIFVIAFGAVTFYLFTGFYGRNLGFFESFLPAQEANVLALGTQQAPQEPFLTDYNKAVAKAKQENKNIFIDFTGKYCTNCKFMERNIFPKPKVQEQMNKMVKVKLITDLREEPYISNKELQKSMFGTVAIPLYAIVTPEGKIIATENYKNDEDAFAEFLSKGAK